MKIAKLIIPICFLNEREWKYVYTEGLKHINTKYKDKFHPQATIGSQDGHPAILIRSKHWKKLSEEKKGKLIIHEAMHWLLCDGEAVNKNKIFFEEEKLIHKLLILKIKYPRDFLKRHIEKRKKRSD